MSSRKPLGQTVLIASSNNKPRYKYRINPLSKSIEAIGLCSLTEQERTETIEPGSCR